MRLGCTTILRDFLCDFILGDFAQKKQREVCVTRRGDDLLGKGLEILIALLRSWCGTILLWIFPSIFFDVGARLRKGGDFNCDVHQISVFVFGPIVIRVEFV